MTTALSRLISGTLRQPREPDRNAPLGTGFPQFRDESLSGHKTSATSAPPAQQSADPPWFAKLMTMFPVEAVTVYLAAVQMFSGGSLWLVGLVLIAVIAVRAKALQSPDGGSINWAAVIVAAISFLLWTLATIDLSLSKQIAGIAVLNLNPAEVQAQVQKGASVIALVWTWVVPNFVKLEP